MSYDQVYDCIRMLREAVEFLEQGSRESRDQVTKLEACVTVLQEELAKEKAAAVRKEKLLQHKLRTIKDLQQQRDSLRLKNAELDQSIAALGRNTSVGSCYSPTTSFRSSYSSGSSEDINSTGASAPNTPVRSSLPPIVPTTTDSDTDKEELDETNSSGSGLLHAVQPGDLSPPSPPKSSRSTLNRASTTTPNAARDAPFAAAETPKRNSQGILQSGSPKSAPTSSRYKPLRKIGRATSYDQPGMFKKDTTDNGNGAQLLHRNPSAVDVPSGRATPATPATRDPQLTRSESPPRSEKKPYLTNDEQSPSYQQDGPARGTLGGLDSSGATSSVTSCNEGKVLNQSPNPPRLELEGQSSSSVPRENVPMPVSLEEGGGNLDLVRPELQSAREEFPTQLTLKLITENLDSSMVTAKHTANHVLREQAPKQMPGEESPRQVSGVETRRQVSGEEAPRQVSGDEAPKTDLNLNSRSATGEKTLDFPKALPLENPPKPSPDHHPIPQPTCDKPQGCATNGENESPLTPGKQFNRCQSENTFLLTPIQQTTDDLALTAITEDQQAETLGFAEMRKRTNTFSPASKPMVGRRTPKEIKKAESKARQQQQQTKVDSLRRNTSSVLKYLSPDMEGKIYETICRSLGAKYGSLERATEAAVTIQKTYRGYKLRRHFEEMRKEGPSAVRKRTATVRDKNRKLSIRNRPIKEMAKVQETVDKINKNNNKRYSARRALMTQRRQGDRDDQDEIPPPLPPPLHPDDVPHGDEGASAGGPVVVVGEVPGGAGEVPTVEVGGSQVGSGERSYNMPTSRSADLSGMHQVSVFSLRSVGSVEGEGEGGGGGGGGGRRLGKQMSATMVRRSLNIGVYQFNRKPITGIQYLVSAGILQDTPESVARFLRQHYGLSKVKIGEFLGEISMEFNMVVLEHIATSIDMKHKPIDEALREFQTLFRMPGEAQKIDKIMQIFAAEYVKANSGVFETEDAAYVLSFSIMMLHTSLHNPSVKQRTSKELWLKMNRGLNNGKDFPRQILLDIFSRIQETQFVTARDHTEKVMEIQQQLEGSDIRDLVAPHRWFIDDVVVYELDDINHWFKSNKHERHLLIFSDLVIITKKNRKEHFLFRKSFSLFNSIVMPFTTTPDQSLSKSHKQGIQVRDLLDKTVLLQCTCETPEESTILMDKLNSTITMLKELEKDRREMLGTSVEKRRCSTTTSTEMAGEIMVSHCYPTAHRAARRNSVDSVFLPLIESTSTTKQNVAKSMEDISRLPSFRFSDSSDSNKHAEAPSSSDTSRNARKTQSTKSPRLLSVIQSLQTPRSPSDGNLATNLREPLRATRSSSPDTDRAGLPAERTQSQSSTKNSRMMVKRTKTKKDTKSKKK